MKKLLNNVSVSSILVALVGLVLLLMPSLTNKIIVYGIGIVLLIYGIGRILRYVTTRDAASLATLLMAVTSSFGAMRSLASPDSAAKNARKAGRLIWFSA